MNVLREKLNGKKILIGTQTFLGDKYVAGILGALQYDFVFMCAEHTLCSVEKIGDMAKYCEASGTPALVRLPQFDRTFTKKIVDCGFIFLFPEICGITTFVRIVRRCHPLDDIHFLCGIDFFDGRHQARIYVPWCRAQVY